MERAIEGTMIRNGHTEQNERKKERNKRIYMNTVESHRITHRATVGLGVLISFASLPFYLTITLKSDGKRVTQQWLYL